MLDVMFIIIVLTVPVCLVTLVTLSENAAELVRTFERLEYLLLIYVSIISRRTTCLSSRSVRSLTLWFILTMLSTG